MVLATAAIVALVVATVAAHAFPLLYLRSPWYDSTVGRDAMSFAAGVALSLDLTIATRVFGLGGSPGQWISTGVYVFLAFLLVRRARVLVAMQRNPARVAARDAARRDRRALRRLNR